jgi:Ni,Fe-hydrogenase III small subunit/ferredoxin
MLKSIDKGLRKKGVVTTDYPAVAFVPYEGHLGAPSLDPNKCTSSGECEQVCPTRAIKLDKGRLEIDLSRCIFCGACARACPKGAISMSKDFELATRTRQGMMRPISRTESSVEVLGRQLDAKVRRVFGRSLSVREVDAGSCNGCEVEVNSLTNSFYDIERFGLHIVASPRHADCLLVTGPVTRNMEHALLQTFSSTPDPKLVLAMGACACSGGVFRDCFATADGVDGILPVDIYIPGCPPRPQAIIYAFMLAVDRLQGKRDG